MDTIKIRELRGADLRERARSGKPLAIANRGSLIGVMIPVAQSWVEHLVDYNWSHVSQSIAEGERAMAGDAPMITLDNALAQAQPVLDEERQRGMPEALAAPLVAAVVGGTVMQAPETRKVLDRLTAALNPSEGSGKQPGPPVLTMRIGELSAERIAETGESGQLIALTHDRELIGIVIPVTQGLVEFLVEQNISRVLYNVGLGEKQLTAGEPMITLDQALAEDGAASGPEATSPPKPGLPGQRESGRSCGER